MTEEQPFLRNHWSYVASNTFRALLMFGIMILVWWGTSEGQGDMAIYLAFILVMSVVIVALNIIYWLKTKYYFLEDEIVVTVIATGFDESVMNNKSGESVRPAQKSGQSNRDRDRGSADRGGRNDRNDRRASEPMDDDDPYKEVFKIFNRER